MPHTGLGASIALAGLLVISFATLTPSQAFVDLPWNCLLCGDLAATDALANLLLFTPLGIGLRLAGASSRTIALTGVLVTVAVESLQASVVHGRDPSLRDVILNATGTMIGAWLTTRRVVFLHPSARQARGLFFAAAAAWTALAVLGGWALRTDPSPPPYLAMHSPRLSGHARFTGQILEATVNGSPFPPGLMENSAEVYRRLDAGELDATLRVIFGVPQSSPSALVAIAGFQERLVVLSQVGMWPALSLPLSARRARLSSPVFELRGRTPAGERLRVGSATRVEVFARPGYVSATIADDDGTDTAVVRVSPVATWALLSPFDLSLKPGVSVVTLAWVASLLLPCGYWAALTRPARHIGVAANGVGIATAITISHWLVPRLAGLAPASVAEWAAAAAGPAAGWVLARAIGRSKSVPI